MTLGSSSDDDFGLFSSSARERDTVEGRIITRSCPHQIQNLRPRASNYNKSPLPLVPALPTHRSHTRCISSSKTSTRFPRQYPGSESGCGRSPDRAMSFQTQMRAGATLSHLIRIRLRCCRRRKAPEKSSTFARTGDADLPAVVGADRVREEVERTKEISVHGTVVHQWRCSAHNGRVA